MSSTHRILGVVAAVVLISALLLCSFLFWPSEDTAHGVAADAHASSTLESTSGVVDPPTLHWQPDPGGPSGPGQLHLTFVDPARNEPVSGVRFIVHSEHADRTFGHGTSDANGCAWVKGLPLEKTVIVETERAEPYTHTLAPVWLRDGKPVDKTVTLRVGGTITGRVLDADGFGVVGIHVRLLRASAGPWSRDAATEVVTTTDKHGAFHVHHVTSRGSAVWVVDGEAKPERYRPVELVLESEDGTLELDRYVADGDVIDVGELKPPQRTFISGVVVDAAGKPVSGALVTYCPERSDALICGSWSKEEFDRYATLPGSRDFTLEEYETLTDETGHFRVEKPPLGNYGGYAITSTGSSSASFDDEAEDGLRVELGGPSIVELRFVDKAGKTLLPRFEDDGMVPIESHDCTRPGHGELYLATETGQLLFAWTVPDRYGVYRATLWDHQLEDVTALTARVYGYEMVRHTFAEPTSLDQQLVYELTPREKHTLRLKLEPEADHAVRFTSTHAWPAEWEVLACMCPPAERESEKSCCGLSSKVSYYDRLPRTVTMEVGCARPYYVYATGYDISRQLMGVLTAGPFRPGDEFHAVQFRPFRRTAAKERSEPVTPFRAWSEAAAETPPQGRARFHIVLQYPNRHVWFTGPNGNFTPYALEIDVSQVSPHLYQVDIGGPPGLHDLKVHSWQHRWENIKVGIVAGEVRDVANFYLEGAPRYTLRLVDARQRPIVGERVTIGDRSGSLASGVTGVDGRARLWGTLPSEVLVYLHHKDFSHTIKVDVPDTRDFGDIVFPDQCTLHVEVTEIPADLGDCLFDLELISEEGKTADYCNEDMLVAGARTFEFSVGPGRYRVRGGTALLEVDEWIEVGPTQGDPLQRRRVQARMRP